MHHGYASPSPSPITAQHYTLTTDVQPMVIVIVMAAVFAGWSVNQGERGRGETLAHPTGLLEPQFSKRFCKENKSMKEFDQVLKTQSIILSVFDIKRRV